MATGMGQDTTSRKRGACCSLLVHVALVSLALAKQTLGLRLVALLLLEGLLPGGEQAASTGRGVREAWGACSEASRGRGQCAAHIGSRLVPMARTAPRGSTQPGASTEPYARSPESREHRGWLRSVAVFLGLTRDQMRRGLPRASGALG